MGATRLGGELLVVEGSDERRQIEMHNPAEGGDPYVSSFQFQPLKAYTQVPKNRKLPRFPTSGPLMSSIRSFSIIHSIMYD